MTWPDTLTIEIPTDVADQAIRASLRQRPMTTDELKSANPGIYGPTLASAVARMRDVVPTGETRLSHRGRDQLVWRLA